MWAGLCAKRLQRAGREEEERVRGSGREERGRPEGTGERWRLIGRGERGEEVQRGRWERRESPLQKGSAETV